MTSYSKGASFERKIKKILEAKGMFVVRSAGSKGPVDLIAFNKKYDGYLPHLHEKLVYPWVIQVKTLGKVRGEELGILIRLAMEYGALPVLVRQLSHRIQFINLKDMGEMAI